MKLKIKGKKHIEGNVKISGAKNSAVAIIPAAMLTNEDVTLYNIPNISDVTTQIKILNNHGYDTEFNNNVLKIKKNKKQKINTTLESEANQLRGSSYFLGVFLAKYKKVKLKSIGGCNLGPRPINYHIQSFKKMNAKCTYNNDFLILKTKKLVGKSISLEYPSVGTTINIMIAATLAKGSTQILNAAREPEIVDTGNFLKAMGADITGLGTKKIVINGVKKLHSCSYTIISDRIEAGTFLAIGAISDGKGITIENIEPKHLTAVTDVLKEMGHSITINDKSIKIKKGIDLKPVYIKTLPYPDFPTDLNPIFTVLLTQINGVSKLEETIFINRTSHISELIKMGANINLNNNIAIIQGITELKNNNLIAKDLRCSAALLVASLLSHSFTTINNIDFLLRGYENIIEKLNMLNVNAKIE